MAAVLSNLAGIVLVIVGISSQLMIVAVSGLLLMYAGAYRFLGRQGRNASG